MPTPFFSIIIPAYKIEPYIEQCLDSVKQQSFKDFECLILNDSSVGVPLEQWNIGQDAGFVPKYLPTDDIALDSQMEWTCNQVVANDNRFKYFKKPNEGLATTKNFGLQHATGKHLVILDGDDYLSADYLQSAYKAILDNPGAIVHGSLLVNKNGAYSSYASMSKFLPSVNNLATLLLFPTMSVTPINYFWDLGQIKKNGLSFVTTGRGEDTCFVFDNILSYRKNYGSRVDKFVNIPEAIYYYRQFDNQMSKGAGFEKALFSNTTRYVKSKLTELGAISIKHWLLGKLFIWRFTLYYLRLDTDKKINRTALGIFSKILSLGSLAITKL